ncbi:DCC1-like thiol-disulfide oxidoreductase family protein [Terribacillus saccharophilus]|uniref:HTTM-like domain-containing protein n=1 Tax=Terribacillus saccharophilus TaxID=361277 RepID=A0A268A960_9BACI|nr:DCC1-like thiol-disulfide oxidoreductase family protein [Terribacillus saccharophilus]PAD20661.1 hypothetical protein CHH64_12175 [Terribacillus saccharophilus]
MENNITKSKCNFLERFFWYMSEDRFLKGASLARIGLGLLILYNYTVLYFQKDVLFSPQGILGENLYTIDFTLYALSSSQFYFEFLYHAGIIFAILFTLGYKGRIVSVINYIFTFSFIQVAFLMTDGGDNLMYLLLFYLLFANTTAYYSLDSLKSKVNKNYSNYFQKIKSTFHNFAVLACIIQVCILYFISGLYQIMGEMWSNGTALYYIMQADVFSNPNFSSIALSNETLMVLITYASVVIKLAFPFLIINKITKYIAVMSVVLFHIGIGIFMGLITFSLTMIVAELLFFTDKEYNAVSRYTKKLRDFIKNRKTTHEVATNENVSVQANAITVLYDGWCPMCIKSVTNLKKLDTFNAISFQSFRNPEVLKIYNIDIERLEKRMHSFDKKRKPKEGIDAFIQIMQRMPLLWLCLPILYTAKFLGFGQRLYDFIASKRNIVPVGQCTDNCSVDYYSYSNKFKDE